jgi:hypothetical protein
LGITAEEIRLEGDGVVNIQGDENLDIGEGSSVTEGTGLKIPESPCTATNSSDWHMASHLVCSNRRQSDGTKYVYYCSSCFCCFVFGNGEKKKNAEFRAETLYNNGIDVETEICLRDVEEGEVCGCVCSTYRRAGNIDVRAPNALVVILNFM